MLVPHINSKMVLITTIWVNTPIIKHWPITYFFLLERERRNKEGQRGRAIQMTKCLKKTRQVLDNIHWGVFKCHIWGNHYGRLIRNNHFLFKECLTTTTSTQKTKGKPILTPLWHGLHPKFDIHAILLLCLKLL